MLKPDTNPTNRTSYSGPRKGPQRGQTGGSFPPALPANPNPPVLGARLIRFLKRTFGANSTRPRLRIADKLINYSLRMSGLKEFYFHNRRILAAPRPCVKKVSDRESDKDALRHLVKLGRISRSLWRIVSAARSLVGAFEGRHLSFFCNLLAQKSKIKDFTDNRDMSSLTQQTGHISGEVNSEAIDFRAASEFFSQVSRNINPSSTVRLGSW